MRFAFVVLLALLVGCATTLRQQAHVSIANGHLWDAAGLLEQAIQRGDMGAWNDLGVVHERLGNMDKAIQMYSMGARWGDTTAQRNLINHGQPVPPPDLAMANSQRRAAEAANSAATLQLMQALQPRPAPITPSVHCRSVNMGSGIVNTVCN